MSDKQKFPRAIALAVAEKIAAALAPACSRIEIAGSIRRRKEEVGDIEIVYVPINVLVPDPGDLFGKEISVNAADLKINYLVERGCLAKRRNVNDAETWGQWNKLARAVTTGIPVDLFATTEDAWWNYLVCRTGSSENNVRIAQAAQKRRCQWHPTRCGFSQSFASTEVRIFPMHSEADVFEFAGLPYLEPWER